VNAEATFALHLSSFFPSCMHDEPKGKTEKNKRDKHIVDLDPPPNEVSRNSVINFIGC